MIRPSLKGRLRAAAFVLAAVLALPSSTRAQQPAPPEPPPVAVPVPEVAAAQASGHSLTANIGLFSRYTFRGVSQTAGTPAVQGGFDYAHSSGVYAGTWASNISWLADFGAYTRSGAELDVYGGYKPKLGDSGFALDLGAIYYAYPGDANHGVHSADTFEIYAGIGWNWASAKYSYSLTDYFGARPIGEETGGSWYLDFSAGFPVGQSGVTLLGHYGILQVANDGDGDLEVSCNDWKLGASWAVPQGVLKGLEVGAYYSGTSSDAAFYVDLTGYDTAKDTGVFYVKKTF
jgi:uncharacterized protein (TIGR02001 family)